MWKCRKCREQHEDGLQVCWNCGTSCDGIEDPHFRTDGVFEAADSSRESISVSSPEPPVTASQRDLTIDQLVFVGLNGYVLALDRNSGEIVWSNNEMKAGFVTMLLDGDRLIVSTSGYMYCLDPLTGKIRWHNPLKGYGLATAAALVSVRGQSSQITTQQMAVQSSDSTFALPILMPPNFG